MLVLSILIVLALASAVSSIFLSGAPWLLIVTAGLVIAAFYLSRRTTSQQLPDEVQTVSAGRGETGRAHLRVSVDEQILITLGGRHREMLAATNRAERTESRPDRLDDAELDDAGSK